MNNFVASATGRRSRRRHTAEYKASVVRACQQPGTSMAAVALANGLNANMLRKWVMESEQARRGRPEGRGEGDLPPGASAGYIALPPPEGGPPGIVGPAPGSARDIRVEVHRAGMTISVSWPVSAASECAAWIGEFLR